MFKSVNGGKSVEIPISSVPVSSQAFEKWFKENVIKKGERIAYDLMSFLTDILRSFVTETYSGPAAMGALLESPLKELKL